MKPFKLLDLYCGAGGAGWGYHLSGFAVTGVDIKPQKHYPFPFIQGDAIAYLIDHAHEYDAVHSSPPCQSFSQMRKGRWKDREHPDLIWDTRIALIKSRKPYIIENVMGAPLIDPILLCGTMFHLQSAQGNPLIRHRLFEMPWYKGPTPLHVHSSQGSAIGVYGGGQHPHRRTPAVTVDSHSGGSSIRGDAMFGIEARREAMGVDWMSGNELSQAIPPAYTQWIGDRLLEYLTTKP